MALDCRDQVGQGPPHDMPEGFCGQNESAELMQIEMEASGKLTRPVAFEKWIAF